MTSQSHLEYIWSLEPEDACKTPGAFKYSYLDWNAVAQGILWQNGVLLRRTKLPQDIAQHALYIKQVCNMRWISIYVRACAALRLN